MATCDPESLLENGTQLQGLSNRELRIASAQLLCEIYDYQANAVYWDDFRIASTSTNAGGSNDPTFAKVTDTGGGSQGVFAYRFSHLVENELYFEVQWPHSWIEGTDVLWHVHWSPSSTGSGSVVWGLEYTWANIGSTYPASTIATVTDAADGTTNKHQMTSMVTLSGAGKEHSSMMLCRIFRQVSNPSDNYGDGAFMFETDFHYKINSLGEYNPDWF